MHDCNHFQALMLEYLYGLVDDAEGRTLLAHLAGCDRCAAAMKKAEAQQRLLGAAAKMAFPAVRFEPPTKETAPAVVPFAEPAAPRRRWGRWAAAAVILLALAGLGGFGGWVGIDYARLSRQVEDHQQAVAQAQNELAQVQARLNQVPAERSRQLQSAQRAANEKQVRVVVSGMARPQAGAPNEYRIQTRNLNGAPTAARLDVRVVDDKGKIVLEEKDVKTTGEHRVTLPPNVPLLPDTTLALEVSARREGDADPQSTVREQLTLAAPVYVTHLTTDKPIYQPGEKVHFRSLTLERFSFKPPQEDFDLVYSITKPSKEQVDILSGKSQLLKSEQDRAPLLGPDGQPLRGLGTGVYALDPEARGGEYVLTVREANNRFPPQQRKFIVNEYQPGPLNKELNYARSSFGAGETVTARCKATRAADGSPVAERQALATVLIDGVSYGADGNPGGPISFRTDRDGNVEVSFKLPKKIDRGQGTLSVKFLDGGNVDTISKPIPIVLKKLNIEFFPEGGDLVAGVPNRVYFSARTSLDKPADIQGRVVDQDGKVVAADVRTLNDPDKPGANQGLGAFTFTPVAGAKYQLKIDMPIGIESRHELPAAREEGVTLSIPDGVTGPQEPIRVVVQSVGADRSLLVGAYCRGRLLDHQTATVKKGQVSEIVLRPAAGVGGVYRITVFEVQADQGGGRQQMVPRAERLVYREPAERLMLELQPDKKNYIPGDRATLSIVARDEKGRPAGGVVAVRVADKRVITLADEKTARSMPTHFLLTTEVRKPEDLEYADFLLSGEAKAREALDLLLGTQGWRRFAEQDPIRFKKKFKDDADRLLVTIGQASPKVTDFVREELQKINSEFDERQAKIEEERNAAAAALAAVRGDEAAAAAARSLQEYRDRFDWVLRYGTPVIGLVLLLVMIVSLLLALQRSLARAVPFLAAAVTCAALLLAVSVVSLSRGVYKGQLALSRNDAKMAREMEQAAKARMPAPDMAADGAEAPPLAGPGMMPMAPKPADALAKEKGQALARGADKGNEAQNERFDSPIKHRRDGLPAPTAANGQLDELRKQAPEARWGELRRGRQAPMKEEARLKIAEDPMPAAPMPPGGDLLPPGGFAGRMLRPVVPPLVVREYAHKRIAGDNPDVRTDFTETLLWQPALVIPADGRAQVSFELCDSVTAFEVTAFGHTLDGRLGSVTSAIEAKLPFSLDPKTPIEVTSSDKIDLPVSVNNNTPQGRAVTLSVAGKNLRLLESKADDQLSVGGGQTVRRVFRFQPEVVEGEARVTVRGQTKPFAADAIARSFRIVPDGFPVVGSKSDLLEGVARHQVELPETWVKGTLTCQVQVYPSTLASLQKGLEALLREPSGCFEQTSTSNYPNVLILDYLKESDQVRPEIESRARGLLERGYQKLTSFECPKRADNSKQGYEWFGAPDGAHEALTAYGLLQFRDMARVYRVDPAMVERTRQYLLASKDGKGGFRRNPRALDTFGRAPEHVTNAYIVWALTESSKDDDVEAELKALAEQAKGSKDPYFLSLVANSLLNRNKESDGVALLKTVAGLQKSDGHLDAERTSITGSGGRDLQIETTALAVLGWLKANRPAEFNTPLQNAVKWIGQQRGGYGGFGSTQATILALKALIAHTRANKKTPEAGELSLFVGEQRVGHLRFPAGSQDVLALELPDPEKNLKPGKNDVRVEITGKNHFPYTLTWSYRTLQPVTAEGCAVRLTTKLDRDAAAEGDTLHLDVTLENVTDQGHGMAVAIIGLPAGLALPEDFKQLKDHARLRDDGTKSGLISAFEVRGRELVLYWRDLAPKQKIEVPVEVICRVPGEYRGPASRAYLYYSADAKHWVEPLAVKVAAKEE